MTPPAATEPLTDTQRAAVAKLACACEQPGGVALLCSPPGAGKTTVLAHLVAAAARRDQSSEIRPVGAWLEAAAGPLPDVVCADAAHEADEAALVRLVDRCRSRQPAASVVLAGEGRLLTLVSRDPRLERAVSLRATLRPFSPDETRQLLDARLFTAACPPATDSRDDVARTIHEIAAGIPAAVVRLTDLARVVAEARPDGELTVDDIEAIHRRLTLQAA